MVRSDKGMFKAIDKSGLQYGRLLAVSDTGNVNRSGEHMWYCKCECGNTTIVKSSSLNSRGTKSCGCLTREVGKRVGKESRNWSGFEDISGSQYRRIVEGAVKRSIDFTITIEDLWDVYISQGKKCIYTGRYLMFDAPGYSNRYSGNLSVDRIDSSKGYSKDNIQIVFKKINSMKNDMREDEFLNLCREIVMRSEVRGGIRKTEIVNNDHEHDVC